jgi:uncharacterized protein
MAFPLTATTAVVTGASSGLGAEFARQLASQGAKTLLLVARRQHLLQQLQTELTTQQPAPRVHCVQADLSTPEGCQHIVDTVQHLGLKPQLLINNAGMGDYGSFLTASPERLASQMQLNMGAVVSLTHSLLPHMARPAAVLNVSSLASVLPMPDLAVYAASKAFVTSLSEALHLELAPEQVTVTAVCPGPTPTEFSKNARRSDGTDTNRSGQGLLRQSPQQVVSSALAALQAGKPIVFPGLGVSLAATAFRIMPRSLLRWINEKRHRQSRISVGSP